MRDYDETIRRVFEKSDALIEKRRIVQTRARNMTYALSGTAAAAFAGILIWKGGLSETAPERWQESSLPTAAQTTSAETAASTGTFTTSTGAVTTTAFTTTAAVTSSSYARTTAVTSTTAATVSAASAGTLPAVTEPAVYTEPVSVPVTETQTAAAVPQTTQQTTATSEVPEVTIATETPLPATETTDCAETTTLQTEIASTTCSFETTMAERTTSHSATTITEYIQAADTDTVSRLFRLVVFGGKAYTLAGEEEEPPQTVEMTGTISPSTKSGNVIYYTSAEVCALDDDSLLVLFSGNQTYYKFTPL
ncbi:MAG: hypothetical protein II690_06870 [Ruminococcus sp.]|nr:hypothetical protein [Ruminococcus sp.]